MTTTKKPATRNASGALTKTPVKQARGKSAEKAVPIKTSSQLIKRPSEAIPASGKTTHMRGEGAVAGGEVQYLRAKVKGFTCKAEDHARLNDLTSRFGLDRSRLIVPLIEEIAKNKYLQHKITEYTVQTLSATGDAAPNLSLRLPRETEAKLRGLSFQMLGTGNMSLLVRGIIGYMSNHPIIVRDALK